MQISEWRRNVVSGVSGSLPNILFHYTSANGFLGIMESRQLWATNIHHMNDEKELTLALDLAQRRIEMWQRISDEPTGKELLTAMVENLDRVSSVNICVFCLSTDGDSLSQWRAYCAAGGLSI